MWEPIPVAVRSKACVYVCSFATTGGSTPAGAMDVCLLWVLSIDIVPCDGPIACLEESYRV